jgi:hypothetical protein
MGSKWTDKEKKEIFIRFLQFNMTAIVLGIVGNEDMAKSAIEVLEIGWENVVSIQSAIEVFLWALAMYYWNGIYRVLERKRWGQNLWKRG